jgi:thiamine biosynthesis lipoprotein ApbE
MGATSTLDRRPGTDDRGPEPAAAAAWTALGCDVRLLVTDPTTLGVAREMLVADLDALDRAASRFRPDSEVSALAAAGGRSSPISAVLADAVDVALAAAELTNGSLDPTMGAELAAAGYDRDFAEVAPATGGSGAPVSFRVRRGPSWQDVDLDAVAGTVRVPAGTVLDLGATAKARCADLAAQRITAACGCGVLVSLGGDIAVAGVPPVGGWVVRVQDVTGDPAQVPTGAPTCLVAISTGGLATSSTAARRWRRGGSVLHHILDPGTGRPATEVWGTVTVAAPSCLEANVASTTAIVRGSGAIAWLTELGLPSRLVRAAPAGRVPDVRTLGGWPVDEVSA